VRLSIAYDTVEKHVANLCRQIGAANRAHAAALGLADRSSAERSTGFL
jgi:DNA-binding CsgD family transcriptional regulator